MDAKKFWESKTFWFFLLTLLVSIAGVFGFGGFEPTAEQLEITGAVVAIVGIILRFVTKEPIKLN